MDNSRNLLINDDRNPWAALVMLLSFVCVGFLAAIMVTGALSAVLDVSLTTDMSNADTSDWWGLMTIQGVTSLMIFLLSPLLFIYFHLKSKPNVLFSNSIEVPKALLFTGVATFSFMIVNSVFIEWNQNVEFPEFLSSFEQFAIENEERLAEATKFLTTFESPIQLIMALVVIAGFAAAGEELLFRGVLQPILQKIFGNHHVAIWLTGFIFAAIHIQFFGLVPRMLLGVLFGYLFYYSGNLSYAIVAHFINNGFSIVMVYLYNNSKIDYDIENTESIPLYTVAIFALVCGYSLFSFFKLYQKKAFDE
ncbi:MAG: CPBP family intramembrane metalloprotease [bacterium]|nr:CPBP family intramembrane metalloprotease [bacterium]